MPQIRQISDTIRTSELSEMCRSVNEPVFITNEGFEDMVIMSMETYEKTVFMNDLYHKLEAGEESIKKGDVIDGHESIRIIKEKYGL